MKKSILGFLVAFMSLLSSVSAHQMMPPASAPPMGYSFMIQPRSYLFSSHFDLYDVDNNHLSTVESEFLQLRTKYSVCDMQGIQGEGTCRLLSMGALFNSMREIDVTDNRGSPVGKIEGEWWTSAARKFRFYDERGQNIAVAYVDRNFSGVQVVDPTNERLQLASLNRIYVPNGTYYWECRVAHPDAIDPLMLEVFAAFTVDTCKPPAPQQQSQTSGVIEGIQMGIIIDSLLNDDY